MQNVRIIRSRRRTLSIEVHPGGEVWVRAPQRLAKNTIESVLEEKKDWIRRKTAELEKQHAALPQHDFRPGELFPYQGKSYTLAWVDRARPPLVFEHGQFLLARSALSKAETVFESWYRGEAQCVFAERLNFYTGLTGLRPQRMRLSSARTRWGSCSTTGTISLNWRLILAPVEILDYVILHELAHLKVKNHQRAFWDLLASMLPDYAARRTWLREHGQQLEIRSIKSV